MSLPLPQNIQLTKNKKFLVQGVNMATGIEFVAVSDPETRDALIQDKPFPKEARLADIKIKGEAGKDLAFLGKKGNVSFNASGEIFAGLGVYMSGEKLVKDLKLSDEIDDDLMMAGGLNEYLLALRWGYDADAKAQGSIALGAGGVLTFGAEAQRGATYAVVRRFPRDTNSHTAVESLANSWILPTHVEKIGDLEPGMWLCAEVNGSIAANIGVTYGLDFNWVREVKQGGLSGDIGLRIHAGLEASLGFNASGKYAVVLCRESIDPANQDVRLRIFKQRKNGWNFALNAGASVTTVANFLPESYDDLIKATFGMHGAQVVKGLQTFDKWTNTDETLPEILAATGLAHARNFLKEITGKDPIGEFKQARDLVVDFITKWATLDSLNHQASTLIWKILGDVTDQAELKKALDRIKEIAGKISTRDLDEVKRLLEEPLKDVDFFRTPVGKWLEGLAGQSIMRALSSQEEFKKLQAAAAATKGVLDGGPIEDVLKKLQNYIEKNLGDELKKIEQIKNKIQQTDLDAISEKWIAARLADFLDGALDLDKLEQIRLALQTIRKKSQSYYEAGVKALNKKYNFNYAFTFQKSTTKTALLDVVFDLSKANTAGWLSEAIDGEFNQLLIQKNDGVSLRKAHLTHEIDRNTHVTISTPFFNKDSTHSNKSFADFIPMEQDGQILMTYSLEAKDVVEIKNRLVSQLTIGGSWKFHANNRVVQHAPASLNYAYSFRQAKTSMGRADLKYQLRPYVEKYFRNAFSNENNGATSGSFDAWLSTVDSIVEQNLHNGTDKFGDTLLALELSLPAEVTSAWLEAPDDENDARYMNMSLALQAALKDLVPYLYFQDPDRFKELPVAAGILVYAALPLSTSISGLFPDIHMDTRKDVYWDYLNPAYYDFMLRQAPTRLVKGLGDVQSRLDSNPALKDWAHDYAPDRFGVFLGLVQNHAIAKRNLQALLRFESTVVNSATKAGLNLAKFRDESPDQPAKAIEALAKFGAEITKTFNGEISGLHGGDSSRPIGTYLYVEAARALKPTMADVTPNALLELLVLKANVASKTKLASYIAGELPAKDETVVEQRLVSLT